ncbi:MAG TPA: sigma 54-interacting transcriptional regulator [Methylomirabilota bacterium]|jgi:DNA-binding NtrC family response regulator/tetratricopeptide (TPR) repeat protein|nr:sigma 54-interacting transcriptional regulator [Methylomirabilota bacterium]
MATLTSLLGNSPAMTALRESAARLLQHQSERGRLPSLLIQGETGVGKGLLARTLHDEGPRKGQPWQPVNCAAIPETLLEAELFGFERGAFTDARQPKAGLFQVANRGTLFLDEVGELPLDLQAKLLKVLEDRAVRRLGATRTEPVDVWIITASNADLPAAVRARRFREDLYHRLNVVTLRIPPLRERGADVILLAEHYLAAACSEYGLAHKIFAPDARAALLAHSWPGNVRELTNMMERVALLNDAPIVTAALLDISPAPNPVSASAEAPAPARALGDTLDAVERTQLLEALDESFWNVTRAARRLGISRDTLRYRIAKHGLRPGASRPRPGPEPAADAVLPPPPPQTTIVPDAPAATVRWEPRRVTLLRAVINGPSPEDDRLYPSGLIEELIEKARSFGGRVEDLGPTGIVATFGLEPVEDATRRAAHAAVAIRRAVERGRRAEPPWVTVRLGIHVTQLLVGHAGRDVRLELDGKRRAWHTLESLVLRADPDRTIVSETAAPFLDRRFALVPLPSPAPGDGPVYRLDGVDRPALRSGRRLTALAGRSRELEFLRDRFASAAEGRGQVVGIVGEAGIGKSRLLLELRRSLRGERVAWFQGHCLSYGGASPYLPVIALLRRSFHIAEGDSPASAARKVRSGIAELDMDPDEWAVYLHHLLGLKDGTEQLSVLTPEAIKARTRDALRQMGLRGSRQRPIVFVCEDLQWIDRTSEECVAALLEASPGAFVLSLLTYRPGYRPPWMDKSYATQLALQPLSRGDSQQIVESLLATRPGHDGMAPAILSKAEGNPFFLEELCRAVAEQSDAVGGVAVPDTVEEALRARIDRLPEDVKDTLRLASVIGREVPLRLLQAVWRGPGDIEGHLRELTRLEFLYEQTRPGESVYVFKHALTQEVVYESLPVPNRHALHAVAARALERLYEGRLEEADDRLAYHYARTDQSERAVECLSRVAAKAARGHGHTEALGALEEALAHVERLPAEARDQRRLRLVLRKASSLIHLGRFRDVLGVLLHWKASLDRLDDAALAAYYHFLLARTYLFLGDRDRTIQSAERAIAEAARCGDTTTLGKAHYVLAQEAPLSGRAAEGIRHALQSLACLESAGRAWWVGQAHWVVGLNHAQLGEFDAALQAETRARVIGETVGDRQLQASALNAIGIVHAGLGQTEASIEACERSRAVAPDPLTHAVVSGWLGFAFLEHGDAARAIPALESAVQQHHVFRFPQFQSWFTAFLADAYRLDGRHDRALATAREALEISRAARSAYGVGMALRALGRAQLAAGAAQDAMATLQESGSAFETMQARYDTARVWMDLGAAALGTGDRAAAGHYWEQARRRFAELRVPAWAERAAALARALDSA